MVPSVIDGSGAVLFHARTRVRALRAPTSLHTWNVANVGSRRAERESQCQWQPVLPKRRPSPRSTWGTPLRRKQPFPCAHPATFFRGHATVLAFSPLHLFRQCSPVLRPTYSKSAFRDGSIVCAARCRAESLAVDSGLSVSTCEAAPCVVIERHHIRKSVRTMAHFKKMRTVAKNSHSVPARYHGMDRRISLRASKLH